MKKRKENDDSEFWVRVQQYKGGHQRWRQKEARGRLDVENSSSVIEKPLKSLSPELVTYPNNKQELHDVLRRFLGLEPLFPSTTDENQQEEWASEDYEERVKVFVQQYLPKSMEGSLSYDIRKVLGLAIIGWLAPFEMKKKIQDQIARETKFYVRDGDELKLFTREFWLKHGYWWHLCERNDHIFTRFGAVHPFFFIKLTTTPSHLLSRLFNHVQAFGTVLNHEIFALLASPISFFSTLNQPQEFPPRVLEFFNLLLDYYPSTAKYSMSYYEKAFLEVEEKRKKKVFNAEKINGVLLAIAKKINAPFRSNTSYELLVKRFQKIRKHFNITFLYHIPLQVIDQNSLFIRFNGSEILSKFFINIPFRVYPDLNAIGLELPRRHQWGILRKIQKKARIQDTCETQYILYPTHSFELFDVILQQWRFDEDRLYGAVSRAEDEIEKSKRHLNFPKIKASPLLNRDYANLFWYYRSLFEGDSEKKRVEKRLIKDMGLHYKKYKDYEKDLKKNAPYGFLPFIQLIDTPETGQIFIEGKEEWKMDLLYQITKHLPTRIYAASLGQKGGLLSCSFLVPQGWFLKIDKFFKKTLPQFYPDIKFFVNDLPIGASSAQMPGTRWDDESNYYVDDYDILL